MSDDQRIAELLERIAANASKLDPVAKANLRRDLDGIEQRLAADAYSETDFIIRDPFDVQRRTHEYLTYVAGWRVQAERLAVLLRAAGVERAAHVVELCPGWAPKTLMALASAGYDGQVTVVDTSATALEALLGFSRALQPKLRVTAVVADVLADSLAVTGDLVVANHILDDLLLGRWAHANHRAMPELYEDTELLRHAWRDIGKERDAIERSVLPAIARALAACTGPGGRLLLTQYPSNVERALEAHDVSQLFAELFASLAAELDRLSLRRLTDVVVPNGTQALVFVR